MLGIPFNRKIDVYYGALADLALKVHRSAMQFGERAQQSQAQPCTVFGIGEVTIRLDERLKHALDIFLGDAEAGIGDNHSDAAVVVQ